MFVEAPYPSPKIAEVVPARVNLFLLANLAVRVPIAIAEGSTRASCGMTENAAPRTIYDESYCDI